MIKRSVVGIYRKFHVGSTLTVDSCIGQVMTWIRNLSVALHQRIRGSFILESLEVVDSIALET